MRVLFSLCCLLLLSAPALADSAPRWVEVKTEHFTVLSDGGDRAAKDTAAQLERMHALFAKMLPHATEDKGSRIVVLALRNRKDFQALEPSAYLAKNALDLAGLFISGQDRSYILLRLDSSGQHPYGTVYHEYTHYINRHAQYMPVWLNEGLARFFEFTDLDSKVAQMGQPSGGELQLLRQSRLMPLPTLFTVDHNSPYYHEQNKGDIFYAESWALTHMLYVQDFATRRDRLYQYLFKMANGESSMVAAEHAFGDLSQLQRDLELYIRSDRYSQLNMPLQNAVNENSFQVEPLATADADAIRADVLLANGRKDEAKALLQTVLQASPDDPQAHESMGLLELRQGNPREARKWYAEAVALHSTSYLAYFYDGVLSLQLGDGDEAAGASLREACQLDPDFAPAADALAHFDAAHGQIDEAKAMILRAVTLEPGNLNYRLNAAEIRVRDKDYVSALSILRMADKIAQTPEDHERVSLRLDQIRRYQARAEQTKAEPDHQSSEGANKLQEATEVTDQSGHVLHPMRVTTPDHTLPPGPPSGPKHTVKGILHGVSCFYPRGLLLSVDGTGKAVSLYSNDMWAIQFTTANFTPKGDLHPCDEVEGMRASVTYAEVTDSTVAGQIVAIELSK